MHAPEREYGIECDHFELSAILSRSVAYQEMKCIAECKMEASYVSELKLQLKQNFQTTPRIEQGSFNSYF